MHPKDKSKITVIKSYVGRGNKVLPTGKVKIGEEYTYRGAVYHGQWYWYLNGVDGAIPAKNLKAEFIDYLD